MIEQIQLYRFSQNYLERLVADLSDEQLTYSPIVGLNTPAWVIGHLTYTTDYLLKLLQQPITYQDDWKKIFGASSKPGDVPANFFSKAAYLKEFTTASERLLAAVSATPADVYAQPNPLMKPGSYFTTIGILTSHILTTHVAVHLGQISAWRRVCGLPGV
jgi:hypothetical protein